MDREESNRAIKGIQDDQWMFHEYEEANDSPEQCLTALRDLRQMQNFITQETIKVQKRLTFFKDTGALDYLKNDHGSFVHNHTNFTFIEGRKLFDYSNCPGVLEKKNQLKEAENTAIAIGDVIEKKSAPSWRVTAIKENENV